MTAGTRRHPRSWSFALASAVAVSLLFLPARGEVASRSPHSDGEPQSWADVDLASAPPCPAMDPPCPPSLPALSLTSTESHPGVGWTLAPPPPDAPPIDAAGAVRLAWFQHPLAATSLQPIHALLPAGGSIEADTPVWVVRYAGSCVPLFGPPQGGFADRGPPAPKAAPATEGCAGSEWNVILDAATGRLIVAFSDS